MLLRVRLKRVSMLQEGLESTFKTLQQKEPSQIPHGVFIIHSAALSKAGKAPGWDLEYPLAFSTQ
jgi:hypothetical protein